MPQVSGLDGDFRRLWSAYTASAVGNGVGMGALPLVAVLVLQVSAWQVSLLAAVSALASAVVALPLGEAIERRHKRPVMVRADLVRCVALLSVPAAAFAGVLTFTQLCVVGVLHTTGGIAFAAASDAHLKWLVPARERSEATSRFEASNWAGQSVGPPVGGALIGLLGASTTLLVDGLSFLASALQLRTIRRPEPPGAWVEPAPAGVVSRWVEGWRHIFGQPGLKALFFNAMLFGGSLMLVSPLLAVLMLRELGLAPWQYGLALGLPCVGGLVGSRLMPALTRRWGARAVLLATGLLRTPWMLALPLAPNGTAGLVVIIVAETGLLLAAGTFNPSFVAYRMGATRDGHMARVVAAWSISAKTVQPLFIAAGGALAAVIGVRGAIVAGAVLCLSTGLLLPWRAPETTLSPNPGRAAVRR